MGGGVGHQSFEQCPRFYCFFFTASIIILKQNTKIFIQTIHTPPTNNHSKFSEVHMLCSGVRYVMATKKTNKKYPNINLRIYNKEGGGIDFSEMSELRLSLRHHPKENKKVLNQNQVSNS